MSDAKTPKKIEKSDVAESEEQILRFWQEQKIFEKSLEKEAPQGEFVFYDGPPYGTGTAHLGNLLAGTIKDIIPRYKTMQGYRVPRRWGWDCHGLPIENLIEKELDLKSKKDIEAYGIDKFNDAARASVLRYAADWEGLVPRTGRWVDMQDPYMTMQASYMESVWWVFRQLHDKGLVNQGFKPMHICPRCETPLANFEVNLGYADVTDITVTAKFELVDEPGTYLLAWTTTPWTLPGNVALAVGEEISYVKISFEDHSYIVAKDLAGEVFKDKEHQVESEISGKELVGKSYVPVFDYYTNDETLENRENGWKVYAADFVTTEEGTGIVHIAPAFGSDDMELGKQYQLPFIQHVDIGGKFLKPVTDFAGLLVKKKGDTMSTDIEIVKWLAHNEKLFSKYKYVHSYPLCWRCDTPLLNYATKSWFVDVPAIKDRLLANNAKTNWVPEHLRDGRFGNWLEGAREWAVSRSRFWGTPLPVWENKETGKQIVIGSIAELKQHVPSAKNTYYVMRHGEAESNALGVISAYDNTIHPITDLGKEQTVVTAHDLKDQDIDLIITSPLLRTRGTAEVLATELRLAKESIIVDERLREQEPGEFEGGAWSDYHDYIASQSKKDWFATPVPGGESYQDVKNRLGDFLYEIEKTHTDKKIVIVTHGGVCWLLNVLAMEHLPKNQEYKKDTNDMAFVADFVPFKNAELRPLPFVPIPHNNNYDLDLHRPYIDEVVLKDAEGNEYQRIEDVFDVWFDSGSMPYAQLHYPFENEQLFEESRFPASFIAEGLDQTRGWFYVLMVLATALFDKPAFQQVVVNGLVLAEDGRKMSKSLKNYPDPREVFDAYGADAFRLFMVSLPVVRGESSSFTEKGVQDAGNKVMRRLRNVLSFYQLYSQGEHVDINNSEDILDHWMSARLADFSNEVTASLDGYALDQSARAIFAFVDDLSTWYVRRSRDRFKDGESKDAAMARGALRHVLLESSKILAPFVPFVAEEIWQALRKQQDIESVHLCTWPDSNKPVDSELLSTMLQIRNFVTMGLNIRKQEQINVRQPLQSFFIKSSVVPKYWQECEYLLKDELNVKEIVVEQGDQDGSPCRFDTNLTKELKQEGGARELIRHIQGLRKTAGLEPADAVNILIATNDAGKEVLANYQEHITNTVNANGLEIADLAKEAEAEVVAHEALFAVTLQ